MSGVGPFFLGLLFAAGLGVSGMTQPSKVVGFLDFTGRWDPSLAFVMGGAVVVYLFAWRVALRMGKPVAAERFVPPPNSRVDGKLIAGAVLFGVGWGVSGFCPGPALVSLGAGASAALWFVPAMMVGMVLHRLIAGAAKTERGSETESCG